MSFAEIAAAVGLTEVKLRRVFLHDPDRPKPQIVHRKFKAGLRSNTWYSQPDALAWIEKYKAGHQQ